VGHEVFRYETHKNGTARIFWEGRCVMTLGGVRGRRLVEDLEDADEERVQYLLRRATGNFKRGDERRTRSQ